MALGASLLAKIAEAGIAGNRSHYRGVGGAFAQHCRRRHRGFSCVGGLLDFGERHGLRPFIENWRDADALQGRMVDVRGPTAGGDSGPGARESTCTVRCWWRRPMKERSRSLFRGEVSVRVSQS